MNICLKEHVSSFMKVHSRPRAVVQVTLENKSLNPKEKLQIITLLSVLCHFPSITATLVTTFYYHLVQQKLETALPVQDWDLVSEPSPSFTIPCYLFPALGP